VFEQIGQWDEGYFMYTEEVDVCYRAQQKGWKVFYNSDCAIIHLGGASGTKESSILLEFEGVKRFYNKHYQPWQYPLLRLLLKVGSLGRMLLLGIIEGKESAKIYAKAFWKA
jgi:N-acetylglucosaminyl-diphospho-decaprenol L-rhamnosyltransferase